MNHKYCIAGMRFSFSIIYYMFFHWHHHHQLNVDFIPRLIKGMDSCFPTALGRQSTFSNILDLSFSHGDASISRKSCLDTLRQLSIPGKVGASFWWWDALLHQPVGIREETLESGNLFSGCCFTYVPYPSPYRFFNDIWPVISCVLLLSCDLYWTNQVVQRMNHEFCNACISTIFCSLVRNIS